MQTAPSAWLHLARGLAAFEVFLSHVRNILFVSFDKVEAPNIAAKAMYFLTSFGHQAVIVFFVLSGFFIGHSVIAAHRANSWSWRRYSVNRLSRLYVVLIPALILGGMWDFTGLRLFGADGIYGGLVPNEAVISFDVAQRLSPAALAGNVAFLQEILVSPFGSNGLLWSLSYEFWYYVLFPVAWLAIKQRSYAAAGVGIAILFFVGPAIASYFLIWLLGAAVAYVYRPGKELGPTTLALSAIPFIAMLISARYIAPVSLFLSDLLIAVAFAFLLRAALRVSFAPAFPRAAEMLSGASYTLYLAHLPPIVFYAASIGANYKMQPTAPNIAVGAALAMCVLAYVCAVYFIAERNTGRIRNWFFASARLAP